MTLNVVVFGNSHLAAVRDGYSRHDGRWPQLNLSFVGAHQNGLAETICENDVLTPVSDDAKQSFARLGGGAAVDLSSVDAIVVTGCGCALSRAAWLYRKARWADLPSVKANPAPTQNWSLVSKPAFSAMVQTKLVEELAGRFIRILRRGTDKPIYLCSQPRATTGVEKVGKHSLDILPKAIAAGDGAALAEMFEANAYTVCEALGVTYIPQNARTITRDLLTAPPFTKGAIRLSEKGRYAQPESDLIHANATYGKVVLDQVNAVLSRDFRLANVEQ